jgi:ribosomal protein S25
MVSAKDTFLAHADGSGFDPMVDELRRSLTKVKLTTLSRVKELDEDGLKGIMPGLYEQIVVATIQIAAHVGLGVGLALEALDEMSNGTSISQFSREVRNTMTETGVALKRRHSNQIAKLVAEIEVQRLAWRHNHEFLSWLGFRRGDPRYPVTDRLERLNAFKVQQRLLKCRDAVISLIGAPLAAALEAHDRFMLANRWHLSPTPDHAVERYVWPLLSFQPGPVVLIETARLEFDALVDQNASADKRELQRRKIITSFKTQLAHALEHIPEAARAGAIA